MTTVLGSTLNRVVANVFSGVFVNISRVIIQLIMLPLMARVLGPEQLGLYALAMPIITFVLVLTGTGIGESLARERTENTLVWSSAFWGLLASGTILAIIVDASSYVLARLANQPRLPDVILPLSLTLIMFSVTVIPGALMLRSGRMVQDAISDFLSQVVSAGLAVYMAFHGFGVWSLVTQMLAFFAVRMVTLNLLFTFIPRMEFSFRSLIGHWRISGALLSSRLLDLGARVAENTLVSHMSGVNVLGTYTYANQVGRFFSDALVNPVWSNLYIITISGDQGAIPRIYVRFHRTVSLILFPGAVMMAIALPTVIPFIMGPKWTAAIQPMMILVLTYPFVSMAGFHGAILLGRNSVTLMLLGTFGYSVARLVFVALTAHFGAMGMAIGVSLCNIAYYLWVVLFVSRAIGNSVSGLGGAVIQPLIAAAVVGVAAYSLIGDAPTWIRLTSVELMAGVAYLAILCVTDHRRIREDAEVALRSFRMITSR